MSSAEEQMSKLLETELRAMRQQMLQGLDCKFESNTPFKRTSRLKSPLFKSVVIVIVVIFFTVTIHPFNPGFQRRGCGLRLPKRVLVGDDKLPFTH